MEDEKDGFEDLPPAPGPRPGFTASADRVQCPNCCRLARVVNRQASLLFYECDLCGSVGATPSDD